MQPAIIYEDEDIIVCKKPAGVATQTRRIGQADYYFGACKTGGGGALAMAIALLGMNQCATVSMPGKMLSEDEILAQVKAGKKAYGFTDQHIEKVVPIILKGLGF